MRRIFNVILVIALVAGAWWLYNYSSGQAKKEPVKTAEAEGYTTALVTRGSIEARVSATGSLAAKRAASVTLPGSGQVVEVLVKEGDVVQAASRWPSSTPRPGIGAETGTSGAAVAEANWRAPSRPHRGRHRRRRGGHCLGKANLADLQKGPRKTRRIWPNWPLTKPRTPSMARRATAMPSRATTFRGRGQDQAEAQVLNARSASPSPDPVHQLFEAKDPSVIVNARTQITQAEASWPSCWRSPRPRTSPWPRRSGPGQGERGAGRQPNASPMRRCWPLYRAAGGVEPARWRLMSRRPRRWARCSMTASIGWRSRLMRPRLAGGRRSNRPHHARRLPRQDWRARSPPLMPGRKHLGHRQLYSDHRVEGRPTCHQAADDGGGGYRRWASKRRCADRPNRALRRDKEGKYVQILKAGVPQRVGIETGVANETSTEVLKGLEEGQEVVVGRPRTNIFGGGF